MEEMHFPSAHSETDKICCSLRRLETCSGISTVAKSFDHGWNQKIIYYSAIMEMTLYIALFIKSYHGAPPLSSASVERFSFSTFAKFASTLDTVLLAGVCKLCDGGIISIRRSA
jgi:hypothetical protein